MKTLTATQACKRYGIARSSWAYWRYSDDFPAPVTKVGNTYLFSAGEVDRWAKANGPCQSWRRGEPAGQ